MIRAVLDTNVIVSALISAGKPSQGNSSERA